MKITPQILTAVQHAVEYYGNTSQVAKAMGIAHSTVFFWLKGKTKSMSGKLWQSRIRPVLAPFLPTEQGVVNYGSGSYSQEKPLVLHESGGIYNALGGPDQSAGKREEAGTNTVEALSVIKYSTLDQFDPSAGSIRKFVKQHSVADLPYFNCSPKTHFVVRLANEYPGIFLPGTELLVSAEEYPSNHSIVLTRIRETGEIVLGRYTRTASVITIIPLREGASEISWDCTESQGYTLWSFQVLEAKLDLQNI